MKNAFYKTLAVAAMMVVASIAFTQVSGPGTGQPGQTGQVGQQGGGRGQRQQGGGRMQMGGQQMNFENPLAGSGFAMLDRADIKADLKITPEQEKMITELRTKWATSMRDSMRAATQAGGDPQKARAELDAKMTPEVNKILTKEQQVRFREVRIQLAGFRVALSPEIQAALNMPGEQRTKINVLARNAQAEQTSLMQQVRNQQISMEEVRPKAQEIGKKFDESLKALLTAEQRAAILAMGGAEFKRQAGEGRPQGGQGGRPGRPGGAAQPQA